MKKFKKIKKNIQKKMYLMKFDKSKMSEVIPNNKLKEYELNNDFKISKSLYKKSKFDVDMQNPEKGFPIQCDKCGEKIIGHKFTCLICDDYFLCLKCFPFHSNQHPMIVVSEGSNKIFIDKRDDVGFLMKHFFKKSSQNLLSSIFTKKKNYIIDLIVPEHQKKFNMPLLSTYKIDLYIQNKGLNIDFPFYVILKDSQNLEIKTDTISQLKENGICYINIEIKTNNRPFEYNPIIHIYSNNIKMEYNPIELKINVTDKRKVDELNIKIFDKYKNIKKWKKENKIQLFDEYFNNNLICDLEKINELNLNGDKENWENIKIVICSKSIKDR